MVKGGYGRIVNIASTAGCTGYPYVSAYCAAKHGLIGLTRALAREFAKSNITVNAVCPGYTDTNVVASALDNIVTKTGRTREAALAQLVAHNPQGRLIDPTEVAEVVGWLCLPSSASITGQSIMIDGGEVM
jgi:NAD(P)-dependent dehydrogenase (short-subunit alcohol dehydrogenase family)